MKRNNSNYAVYLTSTEWQYLDESLTISDWLSKFFFLTAYTEESLAKLLGVTKQTISNYKTGRSKAPKMVLICLAVICDLKPFTLVEKFKEE